MNNEAEHTLGDDLGRIDLPASVKRKAERESQRLAEKPEPRLRDEAAQAAEAANAPVLREEAVVPAPAPPEREGLVSTPEQLRAAREARGLSLLEAANRLRFYPRQLEALESGAWADLPGMAFVRAALRSYARLLEVDVTPLLESLGGYAQPAEIRPSASLAAPMPSSGGSLLFGQGGDARRWLPWIALTVLALVVLAFFFGGGAELAGMRSLVSGDTDTPSGTRTVEVQVPPVAASGAGSAQADAAEARVAGAGAGAGPGPVAGGPASRTDAEQAPGNGAPAASAPPSDAAATPGESQPTSGASQPAGADDGGSVRLRAAVSLGGSGPRSESAPARSNGTDAAAASTGDAPSGAPEATVGTTAGASGAGAAASVTAPAAAATGGGLLLTSTREAWVQVRQEDGKVLFTGIVQPDQPASIDGTPPFRLTIGRASSVQLTYRGIPVDRRPYTRDDVARLEVR